MPPHTISSRRLDLVSMTEEFIESVLGEARAGAQATAGLTLSVEWPDERDRAFLNMRLRQMQTDPAATIWLARAIVLRDEANRPMVGHIGFHGQPENGAAEMGYTVSKEYRRHGIAHEAARSMMDWARQEHGVQRFILSISPDNAPSLALADKMGFRRIGEQMDEIDGLEYVFELVAEPSSG